MANNIFKFSRIKWIILKPHRRFGIGSIITQEWSSLKIRKNKLRIFREIFISCQLCSRIIRNDKNCSDWCFRCLVIFIRIFERGSTKTKREYNKLQQVTWWDFKKYWWIIINQKTIKCSLPRKTLRPLDWNFRYHWSFRFIKWNFKWRYWNGGNKKIWFFAAKRLKIVTG